MSAEKHVRRAGLRAALGCAAPNPFGLAMGQFGGAWAGRVIQGPAVSGAPWMSGIEQLAEMITTDLEQRLLEQRLLEQRLLEQRLLEQRLLEQRLLEQRLLEQRDKLALLVATMLQVRSANLMDVAACLPRPAERLDSRYQWIKRFLANTHVVSEAGMAPYGREGLTRLSAQGQTVVLLIDQTQVNERHQAVMVAVRLGGRALPLGSAAGLCPWALPLGSAPGLCPWALPLTWRVKETQGAIGFAEQREALQAVARLLPPGIRPVLIGDRFYGSPDLIGWCCEQGVGLAAAAQAEPTGIRARRRDHARSVLRPWRAPVERYRAHRDPRAHPRRDGA